MSLNARCQVCGVSDNYWTIKQAAIDIGSLRNYKVQACEKCTYTIELAIIAALEQQKAKADAR